VESKCPVCGNNCSIYFNDLVDRLEIRCLGDKCNYSKRYEDRRKISMPVKKDRRKNDA